MCSKLGFILLEQLQFKRFRPFTVLTIWSLGGGLHSLGILQFSIHRSCSESTTKRIQFRGREVLFKMFNTGNKYRTKQKLFTLRRSVYRYLPRVTFQRQCHASPVVLLLPAVTRTVENYSGFHNHWLKVAFLRWTTVCETVPTHRSLVVLRLPVWFTYLEPIIVILLFLDLILLDKDRSTLLKKQWSVGTSLYA